MVKDLFLGLDLGTSACKSVLYDRGGRALFEAVESYSILQPQANWAEQRPLEDWWKATGSVLRQCASFSKSHGGSIISMGLCAQRESVVPIDKEGKSIGNGVLWLDGRSTREVLTIRKCISDRELYARTGLVPSPLFVAPKVMWLRRNRPEVYRRTFKFLLAKDYINFKLCKKYVTDFTLASRTLLFDLNRGDWDSELFNLFGLDQSKFPEVRAPKDDIGPLASDVASSLGFKQNIAIAGGAGDAPCAAYGCGVAAAGDACEISGTSSLVEVVTDMKKAPRKYPGVLYTQHVMKEKRLFEGGLATSGAIIQWLRAILLEGKVANNDLTSHLDLKIISSPPSINDPMCLPYFAGSTAKMNPDAKGSIMGITLNHRREHLYKAVLEGVALALRDTLDVCKKQGTVIKELKIVGGGSRNTYWSELKASAMKVPVVSFPKMEAGCFGAAKLGAAQIEKEFGFEYPRTAHRSNPERSWAKTLDKRYAVFCDLYQRLSSSLITE